MTLSTRRSLAALAALAVCTLVLGGCVEALDEAALEAQRGAQTNDRQPVSVVLRGVPPEGPEMYTAGGLEFSIELDAVYVVAGNTTVLAKGDPVPAYNPTTEFAPLSPGKRADEGYTAVDLLAGTPVAVGTVEVPVGQAGPAYVSLTNADRTVRPDNLAEVMDISDHMLLVDATLRREPDFERRLVALVAGEELFVLGAPGFDVQGSRTITVEVDLRRWFEGVDPNLFVIMSNTIYLSETENVVGWEQVSAAALEALRSATVTVE